MREYPKIKNIFKFDANYKGIVGINEPFNTLKDIEWVGTEKVDGTNIRIIWDGHRISFAGHTDRSQLPEHLNKFLTSKFLTQEMEYLFEQVFEDKEVIIFGEGYGAKIQTGGGNYIPDGVDFIAFDILINNSWLKRTDINDIAYKLGIKSVPIVYQGNLQRAIEYVNCHNASRLSENHEMEGIVVRTTIPLYDEKGNLITCKIKYRDINLDKKV